MALVSFMPLRINLWFNFTFFLVSRVNQVVIQDVPLNPCSYFCLFFPQLLDFFLKNMDFLKSKDSSYLLSH